MCDPETPPSIFSGPLKKCLLGLPFRRGAAPRETGLARSPQIALEPWRSRYSGDDAEGIERVDCSGDFDAGPLTQHATDVITARSVVRGSRQMQILMEHRELF